MSTLLLERDFSYYVCKISGGNKRNGKLRLGIQGWNTVHIRKKGLDENETPDDGAYSGVLHVLHPS